LTNLSLIRCPNLSSQAMVHLAKLTNLRQLRLQEVPIDDAAAKHLAQIDSLRILKLLDTKITASGIAELRRTFPKCAIFWNGGSRNAVPTTPIAVATSQPPSISKANDDAAEHEARGSAFVKKRQFAEAEAEFRAVIRLDPERAEGYFGL